MRHVTLIDAAAQITAVYIRCWTGVSFSALPKASEDLLSVRRETGRAFHVAGPQQWNPRTADVGTCPGDRQLTSLAPPPPRDSSEVTVFQPVFWKITGNQLQQLLLLWHF